MNGEEGWNPQKTQQPLEDVKVTVSVRGTEFKLWRFNQEL